MLLMLVMSMLAAASASQACERAPSHAQPADAFYRLGIAGEPDLFLPGELYTGRLIECIIIAVFNENVT